VTTTAFAIIGRSSSSFTRVARIFAAELGVHCALEVVRDLKSVDANDYGGNPALKVPSLRTPGATWFGALNICRELARVSERPLRIAWPETLETPLLANVQELVLHAMATEVGLIMSNNADQPSDTSHRNKMTRSLGNVLSWLDANVRPAMAALPQERDLSYLEVTLFCLVTHLVFRNVMSTAPYLELKAFREAFGSRSSCRDTEYKFEGCGVE
jgi:glutathione S-transferase